MSVEGWGLQADGPLSPWQGATGQIKPGLAVAGGLLGPFWAGKGCSWLGSARLGSNVFCASLISPQKNACQNDVVRPMGLTGCSFVARPGCEAASEAGLWIAKGLLVAFVTKRGGALCTCSLHPAASMVARALPWLRTGRGEACETLGLRVGGWIVRGLARAEGHKCGSGRGGGNSLPKLAKAKFKMKGCR